MTIQTKEWIQREWTTAGVNLFREKGDFDTLDTLMPSFNDRQLKRVPGWSAYAAVTTAADIHHIFLDEATGNVVYIGEDNNILHAYSGGNDYQLTTAVSDLGGLHTLNVLNWGGHLYAIGSDKDVYRSTDYTAAMSNFYGSGDAIALAAHGDRVYLATDSGEILRLNDADNAFESFYDPLDTIDILYLTSFRGYLLIAAMSGDSTLVFYRLTDSATLHTIAQMPSVSGKGNGGWGVLFTPYDDKLYFSPGRVQRPSGNYRYDIYAYNGTWIDLVAKTPPIPTASTGSGLLVWEDRLIFYELVRPGDKCNQVLRLLVGDYFTPMTTIETSATTIAQVVIASLAGEIYVTADVQGSSVGQHILQKNAATDLDDGYLETSYLDMSHPGTIKQLNRITVILDGEASNFDVILKYMTDDDTAWTTAATKDDTRRASHSFTVATAVDFYILKLRIDLDDDTGSNRDFRIDAVSVNYTINQ
jgi:hypothetical protein